MRRTLPLPSVGSLLAVLLLAVPWLAAPPARAQDAALETRLQEEARSWSQQQAQQEGSAVQAQRVEVRLGALDPRLRLSPCNRMEPYLPAGVRPWGRSRIGVRCLEGPRRWNVFLPMTVHVWGQALVARSALPAGHVLGADDLHLAEVDLAAEASPALTEAQALPGRTLARPLLPGHPLRLAHLRPRLLFALGETVRLVVRGQGFTVSGEGQALQPGHEGQAVRVRMPSGRIAVGQVAAERTVVIKM